MKIEWPPMEHKRSFVYYGGPTGGGILVVHDDGMWMATTGEALGYGCANGREKSVDAAKRRAEVVYSAMCEPGGEPPPPPPAAPSIDKPTAYRYACKCGLEIEVLRAGANQAGIDARSPSCPDCWTNTNVSYVGFRVLDAD